MNVNYYKITYILKEERVDKKCYSYRELMELLNFIYFNSQIIKQEIEINTIVE